MSTPASAHDRLHPWLLLGLLISNNPGRRREFLAQYGTLRAAVAASENGWRRAGLLRPGEPKGIFAPSRRSGGPEVEQSIEDTGAWTKDQITRAGRMGATILVFEDPCYPDLLRMSPDPPAVLHVRGDPRLLGPATVAVVGARKATPYGLSVARALGRDLSLAGLTVVSGGARGVDREAHRGAMEAGRPTVSVMGAGLDRPYPPENRRLFDRIAETGAVLSEFPFGSEPHPHHFPIRNRIIAGLAAGVVVVEGAEGSGSLITVARALDAGREVFAVPGPVTSKLSDGPNRLLREGAAPARNAMDVVEGLPLWALDALESGAGIAHAESGPGADRQTPQEARLLGALAEDEGRTADDLAGRLGMAAGDLLGTLMELELRGRVRQLPGGLFVRLM